MADELAPPSGDAPRGKIRCGACGCRLAADGDVLSRSEQVKTWMDLEDDLAKVRKQLEKAQADLAEAKTQLAAATAAARPVPVPADDDDPYI